LQENSRSHKSANGRRQQRTLPQGSQAGAQVAAHAGASQAFSQQAGAQQAFSQRIFLQRILQAFSQQAGAAQAFSQQAGSGAQHFTLPQGSQAGAQHPLHSKAHFKPENKSQTFLQRGLQQGSQQAGPQAGFSQQAGAAHGAGQAFSQHAGAHSPQPPPFSPSIRFRSSALNPWLYRATLTRSAPTTVLPFIEQQLLYNELGRHIPVEQPSARKHFPIVSSIFSLNGFSHGKEPTQAWRVVTDRESRSASAVRTVYCARAVEPFHDSIKQPDPATWRALRACQPGTQNSLWVKYRIGTAGRTP
jgi:hypothetical protein